MTRTPQGLTESQRLVYRYIAEHPGCYNLDIAMHLESILDLRTHTDAEHRNRAVHITIRSCRTLKKYGYIKSERALDARLHRLTQRHRCAEWDA